MLGQQVTVKFAQVLAGRLAAAYGSPVGTPFPEITRLFPPPDVLAAAHRVLQACLRARKIPGYHVVRSDAEAVRPYLAAGYRLVAAGMDSLYLRDTCAGLVAGLRNLPKASA